MHRPLGDDPALPQDVEQGRYFLPNSATGLRETIITSSIRAEPEYLQIMPGPSPWPVAAALFTAGFFLLLTVQAYWTGVVSGIIAILCLLRWLWDTDRPVREPQVNIGAGIMVPTYVTGARSHGWWAMMVLLTVIGMIFLMACFSYLYLYGVHPRLWIAPPDAAWLIPILLAYGAGFGLAWLGRRLLRRDKTRLWTPGVLLMAGGGGSILAFAIDFLSWRGRGLSPDASGQGATVYAFLSLQGLLVAILFIMTCYMAARNSRGLINRPADNSYDLVYLFAAYAAAQGIVSALLTRLFPGSLL